MKYKRAKPARKQLSSSNTKDWSHISEDDRRQALLSVLQPPKYHKKSISGNEHTNFVSEGGDAVAKCSSLGRDTAASEHHRHELEHYRHTTVTGPTSDAAIDTHPRRYSHRVHALTSARENQKQIPNSEYQKHRLVSSEHHRHSSVTSVSKHCRHTSTASDGEHHRDNSIPQNRKYLAPETKLKSKPKVRKLTCQSGVFFLTFSS